VAKFEEKVRVSLEDRFSKRADKIHKKTNGLKTAFKAMAAVGGTLAIVAGIKKSVSAFFQQEKAARQLQGALRLTGQTTDEIVQKFEKSAAALQKRSIFGDEQIIQQQAFLASLKFTNNQIDQIIEASVELASATGGTLDFAVRNLAKTYSGLTGELGELIPQLRGLDQETLKAGGAVQKSLELFKGSAEALSGSKFGKFTQILNKSSDVMEKFGKVISEFLEETGSGDILNDWLDRVNKKFKQLTSEQGQYELAIQGAKERVAELNKELKEASHWWGTQTTQTKTLKKELEEEERNLRLLKAEYKALNRSREEAVAKSEAQAKASAALIKKQKEEEAAAKRAKKQAEESFAAIGEAVQSFGKDLKANINASIDLFNGMLPEITDKTAFFLKSAVSFGQTLVGFFQSETKTAFTTMIDQLDRLTSSIQKAKQELDLLRSDEEKIEKDRKVKQIKAREGEKIGGLVAGRSFDPTNLAVGAEVDPETGDIFIFDRRSGKVMAVKRGDTGEVELRDTFQFGSGAPGTLTTEGEAESVVNDLIRLAKRQGLDTSRKKSDAQFVTGTGSTASAPKPLGGLTRSFDRGQASQSTINIQAIDSKSFADFLRDRGSQVIRDVTRDEGLLISDFRGVRRSV